MQKWTFAIILLLSGLSLGGQSWAASNPVAKGRAFPKFSIKKIGSSDQVELSQFKGKVLIVDFWATWCAPCVKELPELNTLYNKYKDKGLVIIGVNLDDEEATTTGFLKKHPMDFPLAHDDDKKFAKVCDLSSMPSSFVIDKKGIIRDVHSGYGGLQDIADFEEQIKKLL